MSLNKKHVTVTTDFLDDLDYRAIMWCDATDSDLNPRKLIKKELFVNRNTDIDIDVVSNGGFVAIFTP